MRVTPARRMALFVLGAIVCACGTHPATQESRIFVALGGTITMDGQVRSLENVDHQLRAFVPERTRVFLEVETFSYPDGTRVTCGVGIGDMSLMAHQVTELLLRHHMPIVLTVGTVPH